MAVQPTGTVTLLFTDIEGSTRLLDRLGSERYGAALDLHRRLLREAFERHGGYEVEAGQRDPKSELKRRGRGTGGVAPAAVA